MDQGSHYHSILVTFADRVKAIVSDKCTIVYTDFACHVLYLFLHYVTEVYKMLDTTAR